MGIVFKTPKLLETRFKMLEQSIQLGSSEPIHARKVVPRYTVRIKFPPLNWVTAEFEFMNHLSNLMDNLWAPEGIIFLALWDDQIDLTVT